MTSLSLFTFVLWRRKWQPTPMFLPGESQGRDPNSESQDAFYVRTSGLRGLPETFAVYGAAVYGVAQSRTRLK